MITFMISDTKKLTMAPMAAIRAVLPISAQRMLTSMVSRVPPAVPALRLLLDDESYITSCLPVGRFIGHRRLTDGAGNAGGYGEVAGYLDHTDGKRERGCSDRCADGGEDQA